MNSRMASFDCADLYREHAFLSLTPEGDESARARAKHAVFAIVPKASGAISGDRDLSHVTLRP